MGSHSVTCHPAEVTFPPLPQPIKAGTRFSDPRGMQGYVDVTVGYERLERNLTVLIGSGLNVLAWRSLSVIDDSRLSRPQS